MAATDSKSYLEYLDKEMTIMGLLSAFSIALPSFALSTIFSAHDELRNEIFSYGGVQLIAALAYAIIAALFFYLQRSLLAYYYGQIALAQCLDSKADQTPEELMEEANSWDTWLKYQAGFVALTMAFFSLLLAAAKKLISGNFVSKSEIWQVAIPFAIAVLITATLWYTYSKFSDEETPFVALWQSLKKRIKRRH